MGKTNLKPPFANVQGSNNSKGRKRLGDRILVQVSVEGKEAMVEEMRFVQENGDHGV